MVYYFGSTWILLAPLSFESDALINRVTLKEYKIRQQKRKTTHRISRSRMIFPGGEAAAYAANEAREDSRIVPYQPLLTLAHDVISLS